MPRHSRDPERENNEEADDAEEQPRETSVDIDDQEEEEDDDDEDPEEDDDDDPEEPEVATNKPKTIVKKVTTSKPSSKKSLWFWILVVLAILLVLGGIGAGVYFGILRQWIPVCPQPPASPKIQWIRDVNMTHSPDWRLNLYSNGIVSFGQMSAICGRIAQANLQGIQTPYLLHINSLRDEDAIDAAVRSNKDAIFGSLKEDQRLLWTGMQFYDYNNVTRVWKDNLQRDPSGKIRYTNFCAENWQDDLYVYATNRIGLVHVIKDYRMERIGKDSCWRLLGKKQLAQQMGQPIDSNPQLPFVCLSKASKFTGQVAVPGHFEPFRTKGKFITYGVLASHADAAEECKARKAHLVKVDDKATYTELTAFLHSTSNLRPLQRNQEVYSWTAGYFDHTNPGPPFYPQWINQRDSKAGNSSIWFRTGLCSIGANQTALESRMNDTIKAMKNQPDCLRRARMAVILNAFQVRTLFGGETTWDCWEFHPYKPDVEDPTFYVLCEKDD